MAWNFLQVYLFTQAFYTRGMEVQKTPVAQGLQSDKTLASMQAQLKAVYEAFAGELSKVKKEYRENLNVILKNIDERKVKDLKEKLKNL